MGFETVVQDIEAMLKTGAKAPVPMNMDFMESVATKIAKPNQARKMQPKVIRSSQIGHPCSRKVWYEHHKPETAEALPAAARIKFAYGDILEGLLMHLARLSGHEVTDEQKEIEIPLDKGWKIVGHMDGKIDGVVVDCKSASTFSFKKFEGGLTKLADGFGYLGQLSTYVHAEGGDRGAFLAVDKQLGHLCLDVHFMGNTIQADTDGWNRLASDLSNSKTPPPRAFESVKATRGRSKLGMQCGYCPFKAECWPGLKMDMEGSKPMWSVPT